MSSEKIPPHSIYIHKKVIWWWMARVVMWWWGLKRTVVLLVVVGLAKDTKHFLWVGE